VLLDQFAHGANRGVRCRIGRGDDKFELLVADLLAEGVERCLEATDAVFAEHRVSALEGCRDADLDLFLSDRGARKKQATKRDQSYTAFQHCTPPLCRQIVPLPVAIHATGDPLCKLADYGDSERSLVACGLAGSLIFACCDAMNFLAKRAASPWGGSA